MLRSRNITIGRIAAAVLAVVATLYAVPATFVLISLVFEVIEKVSSGEGAEEYTGRAFLFLITCLAAAFTPFMAFRHFSDLRRGKLSGLLLAKRGRTVGYVMALVAVGWAAALGMTIWDGEYQNEPMAHVTLQSSFMWVPAVLACVISVVAFKTAKQSGED